MRRSRETKATAFIDWRFAPRKIRRKWLANHLALSDRRKAGWRRHGGHLKAEDVKLGRFVALKFLPDEVAKDRKRSAVFSGKRKPPRRNHPNICTIYEVGDQQGLAFIAIEDDIL